MKAIVGDGDDRILGFTMIGAAAGEVMAAVQTAMLGGLPYSRLADADFAHPTMAEGLSSLFSSVPPRVAQLSLTQPPRARAARLVVPSALRADKQIQDGRASRSQDQRGATWLDYYR
jgi:Pyridine nucleotide-disulphide oxidoreductase, dimerisation domain